MGLERFGIRWNGPQSPLAVPMEDGYWTPWHLANAELEQAKARLAEVVTAAAAACRQCHTEGDIDNLAIVLARIAEQPKPATGGE